MPRMTGAEAIVQSLIAHKVDTLFALPGVQNDGLFNALYDAGDAIRVVQTRHEQGAGYMALGYAVSSGKVGAYAVVPGPGLLNTTAALATAYSSNAKVLAISGQIASGHIGRGFGMLHEIPDQLGILRSLTKWAERIDSAAEAPGKMAEAFRQMESGRPRPVGVEMAMDIMAGHGEVAEGTTLAEPAEPFRPPVEPEAVAEAAKLLGQAKAPLIFVGGGALDSPEQVKVLAEMLQAPVISSRMGRGVLSSRHYLSQTMPAGHRLWKDADVVLAVGSRLAVPLMSWGVDKDLKIVRIDIDPIEQNRFGRPAVGLVADCRDALNALIPEVEKHNGKRENRQSEMEALRAEMAQQLEALEPQLSFVRALREELPDDGIFVEELTQVGYVSRFAMPVYHPRTFISSGYQGTLGWGMATAVGVKMANPDKPVLAIAGDGGFMFNAQELATAVQHEVSLVKVVFDDGAYGNVKRMQKNLYGNRVIASDLTNPDFVKFAESFGAQGLKAGTPDELRQAIRLGFDTRGPTVVHVPVGEMPDPWHLVQLPRVRGEGPQGRLV